MSASPTAFNTTVYFVDATLPDLATLLASLPAGAEVHLIEAGQDGVRLLADTLYGRSGVEAIHLLTHGSAGSLNLGTTTLTSANLAEYATQWSAIKGALTEQADLLIYGCNVAEGASGESFVSQLATLTGADVAASTDLTGAARLGGDWDLEASTGSIEAVALSAQTFGATLAVPTISGFGPATYTENAAATLIDGSISLSGGSSYGGGYIRLNLASSNAADQLTLTNAANVNTSGAISFSGSTVYLGNGSGRDAIGSIDATENGQNGKALKINFTANFTNPSFESSGGSVTGWTIGQSQVKLGSTVINGKTTPSDPTFATNSGGDGDTPSSFTYNYQVASGGASDGTYSLRLYSDGTTANGYDVVHGPYAYSNTFQASSGDTLYFDWKAQGGSDAYDAFGYLMNADTGASVIVLNSTGASASVTTNWATASVSVPSSGNWFFVFVAGTWDATGGQAAGGSLYIDNVKVFGNRVNDSVVQSIVQQVAYQNTAEDAPSGARNLDLTIADGANSTRTSTSTLTVTNVNDAPTLTGGAALVGVAEDATNPIGATVSSLLGNKFADVDNTYTPTDTLGGVVVVADAATAGQGKWQYSTDSGSSWFDVSASAVSTSAGLVLSASTKLRFLPGTDYPSTHTTVAPGSLTVHAVDSSYGSSYTSGATRQTFNTTTDDGTSAVSAAGVTLSTTVTEVNDAPRFSGAAASALAATYTETAAADSSGTAPLTLTGGTLTASDVESDSYSFGIRGGTLNAGVESKVGLYGTLSVNASSGVWSYTPNATTINALKDGVVATDSFEFKVTDSLGAMSVQTFTATINGTNDTPLVATSLADQTLSGGAAWSYQLPANAFTDAEGTGLTYSVKLVAEDGLTLVDPDGGGTKNAGDLPGNLTFDPVTRTFSGNPGANGDFYIQVTASDGTASASDVFKLTASGVNQAPVYVGGLGPKVLPFGTAAWTYQIPDTVFTDPESQTLTWRAFVGATELTTSSPANLKFDPATRTLSGDGSALPGGVVEIRVTDPATLTAAAQFSIAIATSSTDSVALNGTNPIPDTTWTGAGSHSYTIPADTFVLNGDKPVVYSATLQGGGELPTWLTFNAVSGTFSGNPPTGATLPLDITVKATKGSAWASDTFKLTLTNTNDAPVLQSVGAANQTHTTTNTWSYNFGDLFTDPDGSATGTSTTTGITYTLKMADDTAAPSWITVNSAARTLSGNPPGGQSYLNLKLIATDAGGATSFSTFTLNLQGTAVYGVNNTGGVTITDVNEGALNQGDTLQASATDTEGIPGTVIYQWQSSSDNGATWTDIANATSQNFTLAQAQVGKQVRVQVFYTDGGGVAESPVATAMGPVINVNDPAALSIVGGAAIGTTLSADLSDGDGLTRAVVSYQWQRSSDNASWTSIGGATYQTYEVTDADGGKYVRVTASYTDDENTAETAATAGALVQIGAKAPVAHPNTGTVTEASGTNNAVNATPTQSGNLITDAPADTDENGNGTITGVSELRTGGVAGSGTEATDNGTTLTLTGSYGDLVVTKATGAYVYTVTQANLAVQEMNTGSSVSDTFNYTIKDNSNLSDTSTLTITINGANDYPTVNGTLPTSITAIEDVASNVDLSSISILDVDSPSVTIKLTASEGALAATTGSGVTVSGSGTASLTLTGTKLDVSNFLKTVSNVQYTSASNDNGTPGATIAVSYQDNAMAATWLSAGTVNVNITAVNDAPAGADKTITFLEDNSYTFATADFGFTDPNDTASGTANTLLAVKITTLPADGLLKLNGNNVQAGDFIAATDITAGKLVFVPATHANNKSTAGADYTSFTFQVQDNGGTNGADGTASTADDGVALDPTANTITLNVTPVNDAPVLQNAGTSAPVVTTITENDITSAGNLISTLIRAVDGTNPTDNTKSVVTDVDFATQGTTGGNPNEHWDGGVAIYGLTNDGPADGGKWQYELGAGSWTDVGTVSASSALLLTSADSIRFLPDTLNGTTATFSYYIWDGSSGAAGNKVDVGTRGGTTAFSTTGDVASITVTHVNDNPTLDLDGNNSTATGTSFTTTFRPRGEAIAVVDGDITIADVDKLATGPDYITGATVSITAGAVDNLFGSTFETLSFKTGGASGTVATTFTGSQGAITIAGNGTTSVTLSGKGTWDDYQDALKAVYYINNNPNAATGDRTVTVTVTDGALTVGEAAGDRLTSASAAATVQTPWTTVTDLNGSGAGRDHTATFTEDTTGVAVAASTASLDNQAVNIKSVTLALSPVPDAGAEKLFVSSELVTFLNSRGITVQNNDSHTVTLVATNSVAGYSGSAYGTANSGVSAENMQLGLRSVQYVNSSQNPSVLNREVNVSVVDIYNSGVGAKTTLNIVPVNDVPVKGGDFAGALNEGAVYVFTTTDLNSTDVDNAAGTLKYALTSTTAQGTLFRDTNNNGVVDAGEALTHTADTSSVAKINAIAANGYFTQAEVAAGTIKYAHNGQNPNGTSPTGTDTFGFKVVDGMEDYAFGSIPADTVTLTVTEVNDAATGAPVVSGTMMPGQILTANVSSIADADGPATPAFSYQWMVNDGTGWSNATGAGSTTDSYTLAGADQGKQVKVVVSFNDAFARLNTLEGTASGTVAFTNTPGSGGVTITNDGTPQAGETLTANTSALTDDDGLGPFSYQWKVSTDNGLTWTSIGGASGKTYTLPGSATTGVQYKAVVSYTDGRGNSESVDSTPVTVAADINDAPSLTGTGAFPATTALFSAVTVTTVETGQTIKTLTLTVGGLKDAATEKLSIDGVPVALVNTVISPLTYPTPAPAGSVGNVGYAISVTDDTATVTITHTGLSAVQTKALIEGLALSGGTTAGLRVVTLTSLKDSGGTFDGGQDTGVIGISATVDVGSTLTGSNTAPTVSGGDLAGSVNEGGTMTLATADLNASDTEQPGLKVILASAPTHGTLFRDANNNGIADAGEALTTGSNFALTDIGAGRIKYAHDGSETTSDSFTFNVSDGLALSDFDTGNATPNEASTFNIAITPVNDLPTLSATATSVTFTESDAAKTVFSSAAASAVEADENITGITVMVSGLRDGAAEKLVVDGTAIALTDGITDTSTGGSSVAYSVAVTGGTAIVTLSKDTTGATWNGLINGLQYQNTNTNDPTAGNRSITLTKVTETGGQSSDVSITSHVAVTPVNDVPSLTLNAITVLEGGSLTLDTNAINAADVDSPLSSLTYKLSSAPAHGTVYIDANGNGVQDGGEALAANGTFTYAQLNSGKVRYLHDGGETDDSFAIAVSDGTASSSAATLTVNRTPVNDAPTISGLGSDILAYPANSGAKTLEQGGNASISDPDSGNFNGGNLRVSITFNRDPGHDVLSIANIGQIGLSGNNVTYGGTTIGTVTGGTGTNDLVVNFNGNATPAAVSALVEAIQFANDQAAPANTSRTVSFALNDGSAGGQAAPVAVNVNIATGVTPSISIANGFFVMENTQLVTALSATDPNTRPITFSISGTVDANNNPDNGKFEIISGNLLRFKAAPDYEIPTDSGWNNVYNVIVRATNDQGSFAEQTLAITVLNQNPENAAVGDTTGPTFGYATVNGGSLVMTYTDASPLSISDLPPTSAFAVKVGGSTVAVNNVAIDATAKTVTLTLASAATSGQSVTVAYTDPTDGNDVVALQDAAGNDAATLASTTVSNITPSSGGSGGSGGGSGGTSGGTTGGTTTPPGGSSTTTDANGNTTVVNNGNTPTTVNDPGMGGTVTTSGTGDTVVNHPGSVVTVNNTGTGTTTTTGISGTATINISGTGAQVVDLSGVPSGNTVTIDNNGTGTVNVKNLPDGVIVVIAGAGPVNLNDADGTSQSLEDLAPAVTGGARGDGNGDGVADALQSNVTSTPFLNTPTAQSAPGNAPPVYVSLVADSRHGMIDTTDSNSASLSHVRQLDRPADVPANLQMPLGLVAFTANVGSAGVTETFSLFVDASLTVNGYWKQNAAGTWVNLASEAHGGQVVVDAGGKTRLDFQIKDGGEFDADGVANGVIVDAGAAGHMPLSLVGYAPDLPTANFWF